MVYLILMLLLLTLYFYLPLVRSFPMLKLAIFFSHTINILFRAIFVYLKKLVSILHEVLESR